MDNISIIYHVATTTIQLIGTSTEIATTSAMYYVPGVLLIMSVIPVILVVVAAMITFITLKIEHLC